MKRQFWILFLPLFLIAEGQFNPGDKFSFGEQFAFIGTGTCYDRGFETQWDTSQKDFRNRKISSIHIGKQSLRWRTTFTLQYDKSKTYYGSTGVNVDYILRDELFGTSKLRPYFGVNLNYHYYKNRRSHGYGYGVQGGFIIYATDIVDIDIGYHYNRVKRVEYLNDIGTTSQEIIDYLRLDSIDLTRGVTLSLHYFY
ncbi:MAG: hypothetical protein LGB71_04720 [Sulfurovum sp.]|nr:hypothetical protein [Sulfurovum sp.]